MCLELFFCTEATGHQKKVATSKLHYDIYLWAEIFSYGTGESANRSVAWTDRGLV